MIRLLIADDHPVVRAGLRALFETEEDMTVIAEAATGVEAMRMADHDIDLVLMDLQFGGGTQGVEATRRIREAGGPRVLVLTNYDTDADILGAVEAGAAGYLLKDAPPAELLTAVRAAAAGETALAPSVAGRLAARKDAASVALSLREAEVLDLVANGQSNRTIARQLFLSEATVKSHLVHIFTKLGVSSRTQAVAAARERGLIRSQ
ncbi:response regulator [Paramicrobacterium chengjingii]|uniref:Response regulator transcription factor n=1 Tax=Paramicrobacterium chengjingii TaxID=2769067 RepID=A0ABX6YGH8_9MICO|nr:response regulator transcription factor [Microbacterium chengjingii]QPZ37705.1 response regulator transcription factor [Microbacterium chengjingii]